MSANFERTAKMVASGLGSVSCPWCNKEFIFIENPAMASRAWRRHIVSCPRATPAQRARAAIAIRHAADGTVAQTLASPS